MSIVPKFFFDMHALEFRQLCGAHRQISDIGSFFPICERTYFLKCILRYSFFLFHFYVSWRLQYRPQAV